jgi:alkanesulfonate monooxygenase SsuD/methylene tetrahydromethanopterin reductase-like flavin-dependent oxidoreductase (luciferase family)
MHVMVTNEHRARAAGEMGVGLVTSFHHGATVDGARAAIEAYRRAFRPSPWFDAPSSIAVVSGLVGDDVAGSADEERMLRENAAGVFERTVTVIGRGGESAARVRELGAQIGADEMMFLCMSTRCESSYEALAEGWAATTV